MRQYIKKVFWSGSGSMIKDQGTSWLISKKHAKAGKFTKSQLERGKNEKRWDSENDDVGEEAAKTGVNRGAHKSPTNNSWKRWFCLRNFLGVFFIIFSSIFSNLFWHQYFSQRPYRFSFPPQQISAKIGDDLFSLVDTFISFDRSSICHGALI